MADVNSVLRRLEFVFINELDSDPAQQNLNMNIFMNEQTRHKSAAVNATTNLEFVRCVRERRDPLTNATYYFISPRICYTMREISLLFSV